MRLKSSIFVSSLTRRLFNDGSAAVVERKGAEDAGAIFVRVLKRNGLQMLLSPAPQSMSDSQSEGDRSFEIRLQETEPKTVEERLTKELSFDNDIWIVEIETDNPEKYLTISE